MARYSIKMQQQKSTESLEKDAKLYGKIFGEKSSNKIYFTTSGSSSPSQNTQLPSNEKNDVGEDIHEDAAGHVSGHVVLVVALCRPACCARADCTKATCPLCYRRMLAAPELCPCLDTGGAKLGTIALLIHAYRKSFSEEICVKEELVEVVIAVSKTNSRRRGQDFLLH